MTVYRPRKSRFFHYDFVFKGRRYTGSTGCETKRQAEAVERKIRQDAALGTLDDASAMTLDLAAGRWWKERGQHLDAADDRERRIALVLQLIGPQRRLAEISTAIVSEAIERRRGMSFKRSKKKGAKAYPISDSTANRDVIDTLRPILRRAKRVWGAKGLPEIDWGELRLAEPKPKPKEFVGDELDLVLADVQPHWHDFIRFSARYACRISEMFFGLAALDISDPEDARVILRERKGDDDHIIPLLPEDALMLAARLGRAKAAKIDSPWFRELRGGKLKALTYYGAESAIRRAMTRTGLRASKGMKGPHDLRRHGGMKILRTTGNLRLTQKLLGHASIQSTLAYAHALESDLKAGLAAVSRNIPGPVRDEAAQPLADKAVGEA